MQFPVFVRLSRSRQHLCLLLFAHGLALFGICQASLPLLGHLVAIPCLLLNLHVACRQWRDIPERLILHSDGKMEVCVSGVPGILPPPLFSARLSPGFMALPQLCILSWQKIPDAGKIISEETGWRKKRAHTLILFPDSAPAGDLRHLRIWLRTFQH